MTQQHPKDTLQADLEALAEVFEAEEREDRRKEAQRRRDGLPEPERDIPHIRGLRGRWSDSSQLSTSLPGRYLCATHASTKRVEATAYSQRSRSRSGTRWVRSCVARSAASKTAVIRVCWLIALFMRPDCSQAGRHLQPSLTASSCRTEPVTATRP